MGVIKILKDGETDINTTDLSKFALHSDHKVYKNGASGSVDVTLTSGSNSVSGTIPSSLGYDGIRFLTLEEGGEFLPIHGSGISIDDLVTGLWIVFTSYTNFTIKYINAGSTAPATYNFTLHYIETIDEI